MKRTKYILFTLITMLASLPLRAQFTDIDWSLFQRDSIMPCYSTSIPLGEDYASYRYSAAIEYPEYTPMSRDEILRYGIDENTSLDENPTIVTSVGVSAKEGYLDVSFIPIVRRGDKILRLNSFKLALSRHIAPRRAAETVPAERYARNSVLAEGRWVKVEVSEAGIHRITKSELSKMGFKNPSKVRMFGYGGRPLPETNLASITDDLCEVPLMHDSKGVLFYSYGTTRWDYSGSKYIHTQNWYSQSGAYFLTESEETPKPFKVLSASEEPSYTYTTYPDYALYEKDRTTIANYGRILLDDYNYSKNRAMSYTFGIEGIVSGTSKIDISFGTSGEASSRVIAFVGDSEVGSLSIPAASSSEHAKISSGTISTTKLADNPQITLVQSVTNSAVTGYLDYIRLNYKRRLALYGKQTNFRGNASSEAYAEYKIAGADENTRVWCITDPADITIVEGTLSGDTLSILAPASCEAEYVAMDITANFPSVKIVGEVKNQNLHALPQTDYIIIVPSNGAFLTAAERLAEAHRVHSGITVAVVTADQVYNEFSSGTPDATAYRRLMKMLYDRAATAGEAPKYLLLFADGVADNRLITTKGYSQDNLLLCFESENSVNATRSYVLEDYFGLLDDSEGGNFTRDKVDIAVGRIPAQTAAEAGAVVDKIITYMENSEAGAWQNVITLLGDDGDKDIPNQHMKDCEAVAAIIADRAPSFILHRIYWDDYPIEVLATGNSYPLVTQAIYERLDEGSLIVNYSGHGSTNLLSHEMAWKASDMSALTSPRTPFWVTASCDIGPFDLGNGSVGESAILNPKGGAIGLLTTTRTVYQSYNSVINRQFTSQLFTPDKNGEYKTVGEAMRLAKCNLITLGSDLTENKLQYIILGDPALRLKMPTYKVVVDKFNGASTATEGEVKAGGEVVVEGHIQQPDGTPATDFDGTVTPTLFDCIEDVVTRDNTGLGAFKYTAYPKRLFVGSDSVRSGRFKLTIPVPMDISYKNDNGMLNLHAVNSAGVSAQGYYDNFIVGGTSASSKNDSIGPQITAYLNTPEFLDGDEVNSTPCLYIELFDENGINTVGTGVGHDIMAIIDNDINHTYALNSYYTPAVGDYRCGTVVLPLKELPEGEHTLLVRAWDLFNNSATQKITFHVVPGLAPEFASITVSPNPVISGEEAEFTLTHNRPGGEIEVVIELFNFQGQKIWEKSERGESTGNTYTCTWNVSTSGGHPIPTGVYLYRARIVSGGVSSVTRTEKIIILEAV